MADIKIKSGFNRAQEQGLVVSLDDLLVALLNDDDAMQSLTETVVEYIVADQDLTIDIDEAIKALPA